ncbi:LysE family translocator [Acinetobacter baumannii]|uniref:LysE family translocator n=1 Tax=Acinetobacter baumannii TaxID=470 RepID=UPI0002AED5D4|nr:LysE family translocator [Acinetobacter baumannii]ELX07864.1 translocator protein, LysE family [Acinetobacter baumannii Naval-57]MDC4299097.1 LysE family translocator [Acinetobacter baumannii]MDC4477964.1 LysE family translocator [Acinetobacter baumannii]MDC4504456.1 LysE family translocator [Acinetobacter baumannii]MDC4521323.1 LysE family translocator [Acinetobacter baumannii]
MNYFDYFLFIFSVIIMIATPGPVMILVASAGLKGGYKKALETIFGTNLASLILIFISVLVLKGVLGINENYLNIIRILGCLYIGYLGFSILKEVIQAPHPEAIQTVSAQNGGFKKGFLVGISNPKDIIFFSAFFPQFVSISPHLDLSLTILTLTWIVLDFLTLSLVYIFFRRLSNSYLYPKILGLCGLLLLVIAVYGLYQTFI